MYEKIVSLFLVVVLLFSGSVLCVSAEETPQTATAIEEISSFPEFIDMRDYPGMTSAQIFTSITDKKVYNVMLRAACRNCGNASGRKKNAFKTVLFDGTYYYQYEYYDIYCSKCGSFMHSGERLIKKWRA